MLRIAVCVAWSVARKASSDTTISPSTLTGVVAAPKTNVDTGTLTPSAVCVAVIVAVWSRPGIVSGNRIAPSNRPARSAALISAASAALAGAGVAPEVVGGQHVTGLDEGCRAAPPQRLVGIPGERGVVGDGRRDGSQRLLSQFQSSRVVSETPS